MLLLEKLSPALCQVDSSSGALGNATYATVQELAPLISNAPVSTSVRQKWLDRLFEAIQEDDPPYIESLGDHWGDLCATKELASDWSDQLLPTLNNVLRERSQRHLCLLLPAPPSATAPCSRLAATKKSCNC